MLPSNPAVSLVQNYLRNQQGVIEVAKSAPDQLLVTVGERVQATVTGQLPNGRFAVLVKDQLLDLNLPRNTQPGAQLELIVASKSPKLTFLLPQAASLESKQQTPGVALSQTGKMLGEMLAKQPGVEAKAATVQQQMPLFEGVPQPLQIASRLASSLVESGLFYESHQAEWVNGERPLQSLLKEPQSQLTNRGEPQVVAKEPRLPHMPDAKAVLVERVQSSVSTSPSVQTESAPLRTEFAPQSAQVLTQPEQAVRHLVQQQVQLLENHPLVWQGQAWPGQPLQWKLELENESDPAHSDAEPQRVWQTRLDMSLPRLGDVGVVASMRGGQFTLRFEAGNEETVSLLRKNQSELAGRFEAAGLPLLMSQVHHHVDETDT